MSWLSQIFPTNPPATPTANAPAPNSNGGEGNMQFKNNNAPINGNGGPSNDQATLPNNANNQETPPDPLAPFAKLYDPVKDAKTAPKFELPDEALSTAAASLDFTRGIPPELVQKASSGDMQAMMEVMQHTARNAYQQALKHGSVLTDRFVDARAGFERGNISADVRNELTINSLTGTPNFKNPVVRTELIKIAQGIQKDNPDATPEDVAKMARDYITQMAKAINPDSSNQASETKQSGPTNWDEWFDK